MWEGMTQGVDIGGMALLGAILESGYNTTYVT